MKKIIPLGMEPKRKIINAIALSKTPGVGHKIYKKLIDHLGTATRVFNTSDHALERLGLPSRIRKDILASTQFIDEAEKIYEQNRKRGIEIVPYESEQYPSRLKHIYKPPKILYAKGKSSLNGMRMVSIVGTRNASAYGVEWVKNFVKELKSYKVTVVSGMAYGIDFYAHKVALKENIVTCGVMAGGLDKIYPSEHTSLAKEIVNQGKLISENNVGSEPERYDFPTRNRIIVGVCDAVVIVEAGKKSGALITAQYANALDRDVFALPGNVNNESSIGCNGLIRDHQAHLVTSADEFTFMMGWRKISAHAKRTRKLIDMNGLTVVEKEFLNILDRSKAREVSAIDVVNGTTRIDLQTVSQVALKFQKNRVVEILPGNRYKLTA